MSTMTVRQRESLRAYEDTARARTIGNRGEVWLANTQANRWHFKAGNPPLVGLTAFVVAAGPSLKRNAEALKRIGRLGVVVCVDAAYRYLTRLGVTPDYCLSIDSDGRMVDFIKGAPTGGTTLVAMASASPALVDYWEGPRWFCRPIGGEPELDEKLHAVSREVVATRDLKAGELLNPVEDVRVDFPGLVPMLRTGGNVTTCAHSFAFEHLRACQLVFVGCDYSWETPAEFYAGGEHLAMGDERLRAENVFTHPRLGDGEPLQTNFSMFSFKRWHDDVAKALPGLCVNASEGGILGVGQKGESLPGWEHMTLEAAVARYTPR